MIWAALAFLGIPLWLIAIFLFVLIRRRSAVKKIPGSFACKVRATSGEAGGFHDQFRRYVNRAYWVHDVLVVHGGNPFLTLAMPLGVVELAGQPEPPDPKAKHLNRVEAPVSLRYRLDSGAVIELVCTEADVGPALGPFPAPTPAA